MKKEVTIEAPTVEDAIDAALEELGVQQDVVEYEVLADPKKRLFGRPGTEPAQVKVWLKDEFAQEIEDARRMARELVDDEADLTTEPEEDPHGPEHVGDASSAEEDTYGETPERTEEELDQVADAGIVVIEALLADLGVEASIEEYEGDEGEIILDIVGPDLGILIGRHGKTLDAIQTVVSALVRRKIGWHHPVLVDVEGYRSRRRGKLEQIARNAADKAARQDRAVRLRPMSSFERRIVHIALRSDRRVKTESEGEDPDRAVIVSPR